MATQVKPVKTAAPAVKRIEGSTKMKTTDIPDTEVTPAVSPKGGATRGNGAALRGTTARGPMA